MSVTIVGDSSFHADALATAIFLLGREKGLKLAQKQGYQVMLVYKNKDVYLTDSLQNKMEILKEEYKNEKR
jgi:thiamine biosynthesis lipoprotein